MTHNKVVGITGDSRVPHFGELVSFPDTALVYEHTRNIDIEDKMTAKESAYNRQSAPLFDIVRHLPAPNGPRITIHLRLAFTESRGCGADYCPYSLAPGTSLNKNEVALTQLSSVSYSS